ncbi:MAG: universal stress protein [Thermodesulfobacteriota bacterium]
MRILFAGDEHPYSAYALEETARLAMNTWADVILLGVSSSVPAPVGGEAVNEAMHEYRNKFLKHVGDKESPYVLSRWLYEWVPRRQNVWEEMLVCRGAKKDLQVRVRVGMVASEILAEARDQETDLIVLGCGQGGQCLWEESSPVPQKVVSEAECSVLVVKEQQSFSRILACLDQSYISQDSLEMMNQMATIHGAELELVGLTQEGGLKKDVYRRLIEIGDYYEDRQLNVGTRLAEVSEFESFIARELKEDLLALWMGKRSLLDRFFPREWVGRFVAKCRTSVLVMR